MRPAQNNSRYLCVVLSCCSFSSPSSFSTTAAFSCFCIMILFLAFLSSLPNQRPAQPPVPVFGIRRLQPLLAVLPGLCLG